MNQLFTGVTADGQSAEFTFKGGWGLLLAAGTWGSGTITVQISPDGGTTWAALSDILGTGSAALTANGSVAFIAPPGQLRLDLSGSSGADLDAWVDHAESH
jgi:hypothetical protein